MEDKQPGSKKSNKIVLVIIVSVIVIGAGISLFFVLQDQNENTKAADLNSNTAATANTNKNKVTNADLKKYDGKVVTISSADGKVTGKIALAYRESEQMPLQAVFYLKVTDSLSKKATSFGGESYNYIASHTKTADVRQGEGTGILSPIFCSKDLMPDVLAMAKAGSVGQEIYGECVIQSDPYASTDTFYHIYAAYYNVYNFDYNQDIISKNVFAVFDTSPFYVPDVNMAGSYTYDRAKVISEGEVVKQYSLIYKEE